MDEKTIQTLEYPKVLERLASYASFSASAGLAKSLRPSNRMEDVRRRMARTTEARRLLNSNLDASVGGSTDIRPLVDHALRGGVLEPSELLAVRDTLISARELARVFTVRGGSDRSPEYPILTEIAQNLQPPQGLVDAISRTISERGEVMDSASPKLASLRSQVKIAHDRLLARLERMVNDPKNAPMLQESLITQRNGRYVIPLRADFKGQMKSIVHDQSSSGATLFVEPIAVVEMNNEWHELMLAERDEVRRILAELSVQVGMHSDIIRALVGALAEMDFAFSCAKFAEDLRASEPVIEEISPLAEGASHPGVVIKLHQARHPLLPMDKVVAIDAVLEDNIYTAIITGPNTGGKTVTLKTIGLAVLMAQSGLHITAQSGSSISLFRNVFADIGDEQSIEQSLSTFSGHIKNIVRILNRVGHNTLVLFDELGAGTDPQEGAALAMSILSYLLDRRVPAMIATHYPELKAFAHATPGVTNASMEFDIRTLRPTYRLIIGIPGRSNALAIASRLGLPKDIIQGARGSIDPENLRADDLLNEIHRQRDLARKARQEAEFAQRESEKMEIELAKRLDKIEEERRQVLEKARKQSEKEVETLQAELAEVRRALTRARQPLEALQPLQEKMEQAEAKVQKPVTRKPDAAPVQPRTLRPGDKVFVLSIRMNGVVASVSESDVEVQIGNLRVRTRPADLQRPNGEAVEEEKPETSGQTRLSASGSGAKPRSTSSGAEPSRGATPFYPSPGMELDLRGQRAEDAMEALDRYLESAFLAGLPFVRIIHGKGTGRLRQVIRESLMASGHVRDFESGGEKEGGDGVTVARLRTD